MYLTEVDVTPTTGQTCSPRAWQTCKDIYKTIFTGYATYVDYGCIIYLHEADDKPFLEKMCKIVSEKYEKIEAPSEDYKYALRQPCIARYHLDSKLYRAVIDDKPNEKGEWSVRFVDYGNIESVEPKNIRPYAPFPNLPSLANKYTPSGIQANDKSGEYSIEELDQMHGSIVGKFVSVRLPLHELTNNIKRCSMRLGTQDIASLFIEKGWAVQEEFPSSSTKELINEPTSKANKQRRTRNPLPLDVAFDNPDKFYEVFDRNIKDDCSMDEDSSLTGDMNHNWNIFSEDKVGRINNIMERLDREHAKSEHLISNVTSSADIVNSENQYKRIHATPQPKKRMFDHNDYTQMMNGGLLLDTNDLDNPCDEELKDEAFRIDDDDDEDIVEISRSFAMNYWHSIADDLKEDNGREINQQLERRISNQEDEDIESEFENFHPNDTSTVFSHFSGMDVFKIPHFPIGKSHFNCRVIKIISSTELQIFPTHSEFKQRDVDMQRSIRSAVKLAPPLTHFEPRTICLACYSKDRKWYRAVIRSYNKLAKTVEVLYVDYLNSETLPLKYVKQCPAEVLGWSQRTYRVRLHGITPNPKIGEKEIRLALHKIVSKKNLFAAVKKYASNRSPPVQSQELYSDNNLMEISLYSSENALSRDITIYEPLIEKMFFLACID